jgi:hypothetical protein
MSRQNPAIRAASVALFFVPAVALAEQAEVMTVADPAVVLEVAKGFGSAALEKDSQGDPMVSGRMQGMKYVVYFYGCTDAKDCRSVQFSAGYTDDYAIEKGNEWNKKYRWVRAFAGDGSNFKMDVDLVGVTKGYLEAQFVRWESFVSDIKETVSE